MKKLFVLLMLIMSIYQAFCQDLIVTTKGDSLDCKITSEDETQYFIKITTLKGERVNTLINKNETLDARYNFFAIQKQTKRIANRAANRSSGRLGFDVGPAYRIVKTYTGVGQSFINLIDGTKSGYTIGVDGTYFFSTHWGIGLRYNYFKSSNEESSNKVKLQTNYIGPSMLARSPLRNNPNKAFIASFGLGYMGENYSSRDVKVNGSTLGIMLSVGFDVKLFSGTALSFEAAFVQKVTFDNNRREGLSRIEAKVGLKFLP